MGINGTVKTGPQNIRLKTIHDYSNQNRGHADIIHGTPSASVN